jgi:tetratricopeptide (TPR) repeat protein
VLIGHTIGQTSDSTARRDLEIRAAELARTRLHDPARAMAAYRRALTHDPRHRPTLAALAELTRAAGEWSEVADLDTRLVALSKGENTALRALHHELGTIYDERMPDIRQALDHYQKALAIDPDDLATLDRVSKLFTRERDFAAAEQATVALITRTPDHAKKLHYLLRLARIYTDGLADLPRAAAACRDALTLDPNDIEATEGLALVLGRMKDWKALSGHLSTVLETQRERIAEEPWRVQSYLVLRKVFEWQKAYDSIYCAAQVLQLVGASRPEDDSYVRANSQAAGAPARHALTEAGVQDHLLSPAERGSLREILKIGEEALDRIFPGDLARLQVTRAQKVTSRSHPQLLEIVSDVARTLAVGAFELYVAPTPQNAILVENTDPPAIILPERLTAGRRPRELRFFLGHGLGRIRARLVGAQRISPEELAQFVAAMLVLEVGSFVPPYPAETIEPLLRRIQKHLPKKSLRELGPYALEVAGKPLDPNAWRQAFDATATRAAVLVCGDIGVAVESALRLDGVWDDPRPPRGPEELLARLPKSPRALETLRFALSDDHFALRQLLGISVSP